MNTVINRFSTRLVTSQLLLVVSLAMSSPSTAATTDVITIEAASALVTAVSERHRHGPPSKGIYHSLQHSRQDRMLSSPVTIKRYGPPGKGLKTSRLADSPSFGSMLASNGQMPQRRGSRFRYPWLYR